MTPAEALLAITIEITKASREVGIEPPRVVLATLPTRVMAETVPGEVRVNDFTVISASALDFGRGHFLVKGWLRCIARHEVAHRKLDHKPVTVAERDANEVEAAGFLLQRWNERDPICLAHLR